MTPEHAQVIRDTFVELIETEMAKTRRVLAAVPDDNRDYRPDPRSRSAWELATHLATADVWFLESIASGEFVRPPQGELPPEMGSAEGVARWYEHHMAESIAHVRAMTPPELLKPMQFARMTRPAVLWLTLMNNHSAHHRGQLCAYLRAAGSKVPAVFGASADENLFAAQGASS